MSFGSKLEILLPILLAEFHEGQVADVLNVFAVDVSVRESGPCAAFGRCSVDDSVTAAANSVRLEVIAVIVVRHVDVGDIAVFVELRTPDRLDMSRGDEPNRCSNSLSVGQGILDRVVEAGLAHACDIFSHRYALREHILEISGIVVGIGPLRTRGNDAVDEPVDPGLGVPGLVNERIHEALKIPLS